MSATVSTNPPRSSGGGKEWTYEELYPYTTDYELPAAPRFRFRAYIRSENLEAELDKHQDCVPCALPLRMLADQLVVAELKELCREHGIKFTSFHPRQSLVEKVQNHDCSPLCSPHVTLVSAVDAAEKAPGKALGRIFHADDLRSYVDVDQGFEGHSASYDLCGFYTEGHPLPDESLLLVAYPIKDLLSKLTKAGLDHLCSAHGILVTRNMNKTKVSSVLMSHACNAGCASVKAGFLVRGSVKRVKKKLVSDDRPFSWQEYIDKDAQEFPPPPINRKDIARCVHDYCQNLKPEIIEQLPCAVCAQLTSRSKLLGFERDKYNLDILEDPASTRKTRNSSSDPVVPLDGPVLLPGAKHICEQCHSMLLVNKLPKYSLANGLWVGDVPDALQDLTLAEQALISRIRRNRSLVRVSAGHYKMIANVIALPMPTVKVYNRLPPPRGEIDDVIAVVFTGIKPPEEDELRRTPALVRRAKVLKALEWLKLNHCHYSDLEIDKQALSTYEEEGIPVGIVYRETRPGHGNVLATARAVNDDENEQGTEEGPCPLTVHGLSPTKFSTMDVEERRFTALQHLRNGGGALAAGHAEKPASFFDNPLLYPLMFPWLFPYGIGSVGQERHFRKIAEDQHKRWLLNYHDKRFQRDGQFLITAFNHEQMKDSSGASFVMVKRGNFATVAQKLKEINPDVLNSIATRMRNGERVRPITDNEKKCFRLMEHIDYVGGHVDGSLAKRKFMRNELWSLVSFRGAPSWFVTFAPADNRHPLCIFWADEGLEYRPEIVLSANRDKVITNNPVACAKFFHFLVELFLEHILGWGKEFRGVFGTPSAYYGTVEQQGRMTLHLHILIWIAGALSPKEIREKLMNGDKEFERKLTEYLESVQIGQFMTGSKEEVASRIPLKSLPKRRGIHQIMKEYHRDEEEEINDYKDPTLHFPESPPAVLCPEDPDTCKCSNCNDIQAWYKKFEETVDDLMWRVNVHICDPKSGTGNGGGEKSCGGSEGKCYARFPRPVFPKTVVDEKDGHVDIKKLESCLNNVTPAVTYTNICNTDTTSLQSGTGIKAIVGYVCDYLTKSFLKTHQIFSTMYDVFNRNSDLLDSEDAKTTDAARKMIMRVVNSLSAKMELGAPMAALYLLGNPDHYTSHQFVVFYWKNYVNHVVRAWDKLLASCESTEIKSEMEEFENMIVDDDGEEHEETDLEDDAPVVLKRSSNFFVSRSSVDDYTLRPSQHDDICLYEWVQCSVRDSLRFANPGLQYYKYQPEHSMADTHLVACDPDRRERVVPNFIGPPLPRITDDGKECEDYYCAMLTFFKPWRSGLELRTSDQTWKEAFESYSFTERQRQIMRNFNIRFECYDARDDFHAQRRAKEAEEALGPDVEMEGQGSDRGEWETGAHALDENYWMAKTIRGRWADMQEEHATGACEALGAAGWRQGSRGGRSMEDEQSLPELHISNHMNAAYWSDIVKKEKARVWKNRFDNVLGGKEVENIDLDIRRVKVRDDAYIVYEEFFTKSFKPGLQRWVDALDDIEMSFTLNSEQSRAFRIIANHATCIAPDQLLMYLGGMAGSGKTQVLRALIAYFKFREEPYRLILLGPTGTSSALIGGTTYHSFLSLVSANWGSSTVKSELKAVEEVRERLMGVNYIFIDEISMLSCHDVCRISERLCDAMNVHEKPFGGLNMIFAGDFAQLPPTKGHPLYSGDVALRQSPRQKVEQQQETIGKSIWLQFTSVVMLKANMRQTSLSEDDVKFRKALENLRYKACTDEDIDFFKSRIAGPENGLSLDDEPWRYVSIITSRNVQKDMYNELNVKRFAAEQGKVLHTFYSLDTLSKSSTNEVNTVVAEDSTRVINPYLQKLLWSQRPSASENIPASITICVGMPVLIRHNDATDLCITKGQEAKIVAWRAKEIPGFPGRMTLETLFVRLENAPKSIKLPNLPVNVVPLTKNSCQITARVPNGETYKINRRQIPILPNFSMTDYSSQGKTRSINVVDLTMCKNHQAVYTCLSRGRTAGGTLIVRDFDVDKMRGGIYGWLRQEFRELNYLDKITELRFNGKLPDDIIKPTRWATIDAFRKWNKGGDEDIEWHPVLRREPDMDEYKRPKVDVRVKGKVHSRAQKRTKSESSTTSVKKYPRRTVSQATANAVVGPVWDSVDHSCAYDSWVFVLFHLWRIDRVRWVNELSTVTPSFELMTRLFGGCRESEGHDRGLTKVRDDWRRLLRANARQGIEDFPVGTAGADIVRVSEHLFGRTTCFETEGECAHCKEREIVPGVFNITRMFDVKAFGTEIPPDIQADVRNREQVYGRCEMCGGDMKWVHDAGNFICVQTTGTRSTNVNMRLNLADGREYLISGAIYFDPMARHFTARAVMQNGDIYYHDGLRGADAQRVANVHALVDNEWWTSTGSGEATMVLYRRVL